MLKFLILLFPEVGRHSQPAGDCGALPSSVTIPLCSDSIKVLEANEGGFSDALLGLRRCKAELHPIAALNCGSKEGEEEKGP